MAHDKLNAGICGEGDEISGFVTGENWVRFDCSENYV
jgi:hypothetical protein